jgi:hypothetical protein
MARKFEEWWNTVPADLRQKARKGDESNKPLLNQVNYVLLHLHLAGNCIFIWQANTMPSQHMMS